MTRQPHDPSGGQGGWGSPPSAPANAPAQPSAQAGWHQPAASQPAASQPAAHAGWGPPPAAPGAWQQPDGPTNRAAAFSPHSPNERGAIDFFFKPPTDLEGVPRTVYLLLTVASVPLLVPAFLLSLLYSLRRGGHYSNSLGVKVYSHFIATVLFYGAGSALGGALGLPGMFVAIPLTILAWLPLGARYLLPKLLS